VVLAAVDKMAEKRRYFTDDEISIVANGYYTKTAKQLAEELQCKPQKINDTWKRLKLKGKEKNRLYHFNYNYFENIDCQEKAYWLGFIYADGCVYKRGDFQGLLTIGLNDKDLNILELFKHDIEAEYPINFRKSKYKNKEGYSTMATLTLISDKIFNDLANYSCVPNKTFKIKEIPQIPKSLYRHFIRGYFDGDGSINKIKSKSQKQFSFSILGQKEFIEQIQEIINNELNIELLLYQDKRTENLYFTATSNKKYFAKIYSYLYDGATRYMERKKEIFEEFFYLVLDEYSLLNIFELNPKIILKENPYWMKRKEVN